MKTTSGRGQGVTVEVLQSAFWMTNTGILTGRDGSLVLVDPGVLPEELSAIAKRAGEGRTLAALSTHEDWDHVLWSRDFPAEIPRLAHRETVRMLEEDHGGFLRSLAQWEDDLGVRWDHELAGRLQPIEGEVVELAGMRITVIPTPGHTPGHTSLWLEEDGILIAGDMLSDIDIPMLAPDSNAANAYLRSLAALEPLVNRATLVIPGHGSACDGSAARRRLQADRAYIEALVAWSMSAGKNLPELEAMLPGDARPMRSENVDAHRQHGATVGL